MVGHGDHETSKPALDPYPRASKRLGIAPKHCFALEDSHNGVRSAATAGMMTIMPPCSLVSG
ncbi:HAD family hydrolase [Bosea sp. UC22_33]|uniref:HAD family hydrolase n=1 Tax=Bosea sp. UC22_33 TaxID=3350165 RepID=UPI00366AEF8C